MLPKAASLEWPAEPFRSQFLDVLKGLEMARFTRRHPKLLPPLLKQFLELVAVSGLGGGVSTQDACACVPSHAAHPRDARPPPCWLLAGSAQGLPPCA